MKRDLLSKIFWPHKQVIQKSVGKYDKTPWYSSVRFALLCFVVITVPIAAVLSHDLWGILGMIIMMIPMGYFVMRGYRFAYVALGCFRLFDTVITIPSLVTNDKIGLMVLMLIWTAIWVCLCITCYRIETLRREKRENIKRVTTLDKVLFVVLVLVTAFFAYGIYRGQTDPRTQLIKKYGAHDVDLVEVTYMNTVATQKLCLPIWENIITNSFGNKENIDTFQIIEKRHKLYLDTYVKDTKNLSAELFKEFEAKLGSQTLEKTKEAVEASRKPTETTWTQTYYRFCHEAIRVTLALYACEKNTTPECIENLTKVQMFRVIKEKQ